MCAFLNLDFLNFLLLKNRSERYKYQIKGILDRALYQTDSSRSESLSTQLTQKYIHSDRSSLSNDRVPVGNTLSRSQSTQSQSRCVLPSAFVHEKERKRNRRTRYYVRYQNTLTEFVIALVIKTQAATFH